MFVSRFFGVAVLLSGFASAIPHKIRDSSINEPAVSAPNGSPITDGTPEATAAAADNQVASSSVSSADAQYTAAATTSTAWQASSTWQASTSVWDATSTSAAWGSYQTPTYGSGSSNWGNSDYNDCVQQCVAKWGSAPQPYTPPPSVTSDSSSGGSGATHTVIVAPTQGVLRYIPFALNASVGDTVKFIWGANNHTVTKSSTLEPCNNTLDSPFASGVQLKDFVYTQVVNDTNPTFFHCAVPGHCQKGMFGIINPPSNTGSPTSVSMMMSTWASSDPSVATYLAAADMVTKNNTFAAGWGGNMDVGSLPEWSHSEVAKNVAYTRAFLASNPETIKDDRVDLSSAQNGTPLMFPQDFDQVLSSNDGATNATPPAAATSLATAVATSTQAAVGASSNLNNGANALASSKTAVAFIVAVATFFML
jgi:plastocyanin